MNLQQALMQNNLDEVKTLIDNDSSIVNQPDDRGFPPLTFAAYMGNEIGRAHV